VSRTTISLASLTVLAVLVHIVAGLWAHDLGTAVVLLCVNLFALAAGAAYARSLPQRRVLLYVGGYAALFLLVAVIAREPLLFAIFGLLYAAVFRSTHLLGYLVILVLSLLLVPMYWFQTLVLAGMLPTAREAPCGRLLRHRLRPPGGGAASHSLPRAAELAPDTPRHSRTGRLRGCAR
jgi:hypothetical protein